MCRQIIHWQTDGRHVKQTAAEDKDSIPSLLYWCYFKISTVPGQRLKVTIHTHVHYIWRLTEFPWHIQPWYVFLSLGPQRPRLQNCLDYIFSLHQTSVFYLPLSFSDFLLVSPSLFSKLPSRAGKTALSCDTNFPSKVAHWLQLNHTKISTLWQQPQLVR